MLLVMMTAGIRWRLSSHCCPCCLWYCRTEHLKKREQVLPAALFFTVKLANIVSTHYFVSWSRICTPGKSNISTTYAIPCSA